MDIITIGITVAAWTKFGNQTISIIALVCSLFETIGGFCLYNISDSSEGIWSSIVGAICLVLCIVRVFGAK